MLPDDFPETLDYHQVALLLKVFPITIIRLVERQELPSADGLTITKQDLDSYLEKNSTINAPLL